MIKKFVIQNNLGKKLGEIIYSKEKFEVNVSPKEEKDRLEKLFDSLLEEGISDLGEVILKEPIRPSNPLFFDEVRNYLARRGYILIEKN